MECKSNSQSTQPPRDLRRVSRTAQSAIRRMIVDNGGMLASKRESNRALGIVSFEAEMPDSRVAAQLARVMSHPVYCLKPAFEPGDLVELNADWVRHNSGTGKYLAGKHARVVGMSRTPD